MSPLLIVAALLVANAFFVTAEFSLVGAPRAAVEHAAARGSAGARRVLALLDDPYSQDRFIATSQIGISLASIALGMYGEHEIARVLEAQLPHTGAVSAHTMATAVALVVLTILHIVIGEIVPKALALQSPARVIGAIVPVMGAVETALGPLVGVLSRAGRFVLGLAGIARDGEQSDRHHSTAELQYVIEESERGGLLEGESGAVLRGLFTFGDLTASAVMVPASGTTGLELGTSAAAIRALIRETPHTRYLVREHGTVTGIVHIKSLLRIVDDGAALTRRDVRDVPSVRADATLDAVLATLRTHRAQLAVVHDARGGLAGLVTMEDLCEEVLGTIDEGR